MTLENRCFSSLKWLVFYLEGHKTLRFGFFFLKNKKGQNFQFLTKNHSLTPLEKWQIFAFFKWMFFEFKMARLLSRSSQNTLFGLFLLENKKGQNFQFLTKNHGLIPLEKNKFYLSYLYLSFFFICIKFAIFAWIKGSELASAKREWLMTKCKRPIHKN